MEVLQEGTTPNAEEPSETADTKIPDVAPQTEGDNEEQSEQNTDNQNAKASETEEFLFVNVNHEGRALSREEAVKYAQLGLQKEYLDPFIAKIDYLAAVNGMSREEFIEGQLKSYEEAMRQEIISKFGDDENTVSEMIEFTKQKHKKAYDDMIARQQQAEKTSVETVETRLANEFGELVKEFPELEEKGFKGLPVSVKQAGFKGEKLLNAYLYYKHNENKKIAVAQDSAIKQNKVSVGSLKADSLKEMQTDAEKQFLKALWGK